MYLKKVGNFEIEVDAHEIIDWVENQPNRDRAKETVMIRIGAEAKRKLIDEAREIRASGDLQKSIDFKANKDEVEVNSLGYGEEALETGSPRGTIVQDMTALRRWAQLKLGNPYYATAIAKRIKEQGSSKARGTYHFGTVKQITKVFDYLNDDFIPKQLPELLDKFAE